ncbi:MAG: beta-ketoacyl-[acyl-carrier-protein] synthase family protein [Candidatus Omnitrophica bacterium]|nr:beta-ketoacyl-[acyl-carrier-protein] synthase family protein [Candidatus Omnitrophota bacterium]
MIKRVVVTGLGVISSIGTGKGKFWDNLLKGQSGISKVESFDTSNYQSHNGGEVKDFDANKFIGLRVLPSLCRTSQFAVSAAGLAIEDAGLEGHDFSRSVVSVCLGTTMGESRPIEHLNNELAQGKSIERLDVKNMGLSFVNNIPVNIALEFQFKGRNRVFTTACAAGNYAISYGLDLLRMGASDFVVAGGVDAFSRIVFTGFDRVHAIAPEKCQPFDKNRKGMIPGEGAGILILETLKGAKTRGAHIYAEVLGCGFSCDAFHMTQPLMDGIFECMKNALDVSGIKKKEVSYICAHGTGSVLNDKAECGAINKIFKDQRIPVNSCKSMLGHTMGAASAIEAIACCLAVENDVVPPTINFETPDPECDIDCVPNKAREQRIHVALNNGFAFGGNNACLVLKKYDENE